MGTKNKVVVIYKSKTGFAKTYANWIAEELHCDIKENNKLLLSDLLEYDVIIYGAGLYAIGINGINLIKSNFEELKEKKLIVFATGATPPRDEDMDRVWETNFSEEQRKVIKRFYLRGGFNHSKLGVGLKVLMSMKKVQLKKDQSEDAKGMLEAFDKPVDFTNRENIKPLLQYVAQLIS